MNWQSEMDDLRRREELAEQLYSEPPRSGLRRHESIRAIDAESVSCSAGLVRPSVHW